MRFLRALKRALERFWWVIGFAIAFVVFYPIRGRPRRFTVEGDSLVVERGRSRTSHGFHSLSRVTVQVRPPLLIPDDDVRLRLEFRGDARSNLTLHFGHPDTGPVMDRLFELPGFDHRAFTEAMATVKRKDWVVWESQGITH